MRSTAVVAAISAALLITGCTGDAAKPSSQPPDATGSTHTPTLRWHECSADIDARFLSRHRCGTLVVPQSRDDAGAGSLDLAVIQAWPIGVEPREGLVTGFATNLGDPRVFGGNMATGATRLRSVVVELAFRGTNPSSPSLACPEVEALGVRAAGLPDDDARLRQPFLQAVSSCAARLRESGVEPAHFDSAAAAADLEDLRVAMGVDSWSGAGSYGTQSRVLFRYLDDFPGRLEAAWLDSPWFPDTDDLTGGALGTRSALAELFAACSADPRCESRYPQLEQTWDRALLSTEARPLTGRGESGEGNVRVVVDDAKLLRFVRYSLGGEGPTNLAWLPRVITAAAAGRLHPHLADLVASDPPFCAGYRPLCVNMEGFGLGVYLTSLCKEQVPALDEDALRDATAGHAAYKQVFEESPYLEACAGWDTPGEEVAPPANPHGTPLLLIPGQFDSFSRPEWSEPKADEQEHVWTFTAPNNTHNTLGYDECALSVRNAWINTPRAAPDPALCATPPTLTFR